MKKLLLFGLGLFSLVSVQAQQDPMFSQYLYNMLAINPAYAGSRNQLSTVMFYRNQWTGFDGAPVTFNVSAHAPFKKTNGSWGVNAFSDRIGVQKQNFLNFNYAYRITGSKGILSLGMSGGIYQFGYNFNELKLNGVNDPLLQGSESYSLFNAGFGAYYQTSRLAISFSVPHLFNREIINKSAYFNVNPKNHIYLSGSYLMVLSNDFRFKPSLMVKYVNNTPMQLDVNATFIYKNAFYFGASYRTYQEISIMAQYQLNKNWWFGYAYDVPFGAVSYVSRGSHELFLGFEISFDKSKMLSPRYF